MRMRFKPYARPELAAWEHFIDYPDTHAGNWRMLYTDPSLPLRVELGCGKGGFLAQLSLQEPEYNYLGIDIKSEMLVVAKRSIETARRDARQPIDNCKLTSHDIERLQGMLKPSDDIHRIYINFCNPWYKSGHAKHRLTHPRQLIQYHELLCAEGQIHFKTDDDLLYADSLRYFEMTGFEILYQTRDLHAEPGIMPIMTEHERMFSREGIPIKACIARKLPIKLDKEHFSRLRNI